MEIDKTVCTESYVSRKGKAITSRGCVSLEVQQHFLQGVTSV
jgi:hypothetical protein